MGIKSLDTAKIGRLVESRYSDDFSFDTPDEAFSDGISVVAKLMRDGTLSEEQAAMLLSRLLVPYIETVIVRDVENYLIRSLSRGR